MKSRSTVEHASKPDWVRLPPDAIVQTPPVLTRSQRLPFEELTWENFERLCFRLAALDGDVAHWALFGRAGQKQDGIDIFVRHRSKTHYTCWQVKKRKKFTAALVREAIKRFRTGQWAEKSTRFVLCVYSGLQDSTLQAAIETEAAVLKQDGVELVPLDFDGLTVRLKAAPELIDDFFGREWVAAACGKDVASSLQARLTGADVISLRKELLAHYRNYFDAVDPGLAPRSLDIADADKLPSVLDRFVVPDIELTVGIAPESSKAEVKPASTGDTPDTPSLGQVLSAATTASIRQPVSSWLVGAERSVVIADAGYGKSTLLRALAMALLSGGTQFPEMAAMWADHLPILIPFAFWSRLVATGETEVSLLDAVNLWFKKFDISPTFSDLILKSLGDARLLLLVDGLDEWADETAARSTLTLLDTFVKSKKVIAVVTGRPSGLLKLGGLDPSWRRAKLAPLNEVQQRRFAAIRFGQCAETGTTRRMDAQTSLDWRVTNFFKDVQQIVRLGPLAEMPLMLSGLISLAHFRIALPQSRFGAYDELIKLMLEEHPKSRARASLDRQSRYEIMRDPTLRRRALAFLAHHNRNVAQQSTFAVSDARKLVATFLEESEGFSRRQSVLGADELVGVTAEMAGLLIEKAPGEIAFVHSLFEEALAGEHLSGLDLQAQRDAMQTHGGDVRWTNVLLALLHRLSRAQDVESLVRSIFPPKPNDPGSATVCRLCAEVAFGEFKCTPGVGNEVADFTFAQIESTSWYPERIALLELVLDGSNESRREKVEAKLKQWFPDSLRHYQSVYAAMCDWNPSAELAECFLRGLFAEDDENKMAAARALAVKFGNDENVKDRLRVLIALPHDDGTIAAGIEALRLGWPQAEFLPEIIADARKSGSSKLRVVAIRAALANKTATAEDMDALLEFSNRYQYRRDLHGVGNALCEGWSISPRVAQAALESASGDSHPRSMDFMLARAVLLIASATDTMLDEKAAELIRSEKYYFSMMGNGWGEQPYGPQVRRAIDEVLLAHDNVMYNEVANAIIASRSPAAKKRALDMLNTRDSWIFWPIHALLRGWGADDPDVASALGELTELPPEEAQYFAQYLPQLIPDKAIARERLLAIVQSPQLVRFDFAITGLVDLGITSDDKDVMDALLNHASMCTRGYDGSNILIANFGGDPRVRAIALDSTRRPGTPWPAIARGYKHDSEMRDLVLSSVGALPTPLRAAIVNQAARRCDERAEFRELLEQYDSEDQRDCRNAAALGYYGYLARNTPDLEPAEQRLRRELVEIGPNMDDIRQAAFLGLAAIGKAAIVPSISDLEKGGLNFFDTIDDSPTLLSYIARNWTRFKEDLGEDGLWRLNKHYAKEATAWRQLAPYVGESAAVRDDFLKFVAENPGRISAAGLETLSRLTPRSELLRDQCLQVLDRNQGSDNQYDSTRAHIVAGRILGDQFAGDDDIRKTLEAYRFASSTVVVGLSLGWPASSKLQDLNSQREKNIALFDAHGGGREFPDYSLPAVLHLLGACVSPQRFLKAINQVIEQCTGDIWEFGDYLALPVTARLGRDTELSGLMMDALAHEPTPHQRASFARLLAAAGAQQAPLRAWCVQEYTRQSVYPGLQEFGFDLMAGRIRPISRSMLDVLTPESD